MRNSILQADTTCVTAGDTNTIWRVFAHRGMGYFAGALDGDDTTPVEDFSMPPRANAPKANVSGTVTDGDTHAADRRRGGGLRRTRFGVPDRPGRDDNGSAGSTSSAACSWRRTPKFFASKLGYDRQAVDTLTVPAGGVTHDFALRA